MSSSAEVHIRLQDESNLQTSQSQVASSSSTSNVDGSDHSSVIQCQVCQVASSISRFFSSHFSS